MRRLIPKNGVAVPKDLPRPRSAVDESATATLATPTCCFVDLVHARASRDLRWRRGLAAPSGSLKGTRRATGDERSWDHILGGYRSGGNRSGRLRTGIERGDERSWHGGPIS